MKGWALDSGSLGGPGAASSGRWWVVTPFLSGVKLQSLAAACGLSEGPPLAEAPVGQAPPGGGGGNVLVIVGWGGVSRWAGRWLGGVA